MTGEELKAARKTAGLTQEALGLAIGYSKSSAERVVQLWEHDKQPIPTKYYRALAKALGLSLNDIVP